VQALLRTRIFQFLFLLPAEFLLELKLEIVCVSKLRFATFRTEDDVTTIT
jgi:hypothetical protein